MTIKGLVVYDSASGNTEKMAICIGRGMEKAGLEVEVKRTKDTTNDDLSGADTVVLGSPTYFGDMSNNMKLLIDRSVKIHPDKLKDKVGAAFTSSKGQASDMTLLSLITAMLIHGMIIVGHPSGVFGAVSIQAPDDDGATMCEDFGERIGNFAKAITESSA